MCNFALVFLLLFLFNKMFVGFQLTADFNVDNSGVLSQFVLSRDPVRSGIQLAGVTDRQNGVTFWYKYTGIIYYVNIIFYTN